MNRIERQALILKRLKFDAEVTVTELCKLCDTSEMTIRRDLAEMDRAGLVRRVHGGAILPDGRSYEPPYSLRAAQDLLIKRSLAMRALDFIHDGDSIALDVGTTILELASLLGERRGLTVVTASLPVAQKIIEVGMRGPAHRLIITGGETRPGELSMIGDLAQRTYKELHVDKAFVGIGGVSLADGLTEYNVEDAMVKRELLHSANQVYLLADSSKFGRTTFTTVGQIEQVGTFITDSGISTDMVDGLTARGRTIHTIERDGAEGAPLREKREEL